MPQGETESQDTAGMEYGASESQAEGALPGHLLLLPASQPASQPKPHHKWCCLFGLVLFRFCAPSGALGFLWRRCYDVLHTE